MPTKLLWTLVASIPLASALALALPMAQAKPTPASPGVSPQAPPNIVPTAPTTPSGPSAVDPGKVTISTSLVSPGSDVARRWITPVLEWVLVQGGGGSRGGIKRAPTDLDRRYWTIGLINVDTKLSVTVRILCYGENGQLLVSARENEHTLAPRAFAEVLPPLPQGERHKGWCTIDAPRPVVAYGSWSSRQRSLSSSSYREFAQQTMAPFFKAEP